MKMSRLPLLIGCTALFVSCGFPLLGGEPSNPLRPSGPREVEDEPARRASVAAERREVETSDPDNAAGAVQQVSYREELAERPARRIQRRHGQPRPEATLNLTDQPSVLKASRTTALGGGEFIMEGDAKSLTDDWIHGGFEGGDCCGGAGCAQCCFIPLPCLSLDNFEFFGGVQGFTGPKNRGQSGSFGFHTGFNWGAPVPCTAGSLGMQIGVNGAFSNFSGAAFTREDRNQVFVTGGLFRRVDWGLQAGVAVDYQSDRWYTDTDLTQVRGEVSWMFPCTHELGFWFASHTEDDTQVSTFTGAASLTETWRATDLYAFFYRHRFAACDGANARFYAGFTDGSDGLIGGDLRIPLGCDWALETGFTYLIPDESTTGMAGGGHEHESWNVAISMVWYPGMRQASGTDYFRPLFDVADNGNFMVHRR